MLKKIKKDFNNSIFFGYRRSNKLPNGRDFRPCTSSTLESYEYWRRLLTLGLLRKELWGYSILTCWVKFNNYITIKRLITFLLNIVKKFWATMPFNYFQFSLSLNCCCLVSFATLCGSYSNYIINYIYIFNYIISKWNIR